MKRAAVFFDRDNTLMACDGYLGEPSQVVLLEGAAHAVARARALGYATVVVSNQSGVARGMFDEEAVRAVNARLDELLKAENPAANLPRTEFFPFHPKAAVRGATPTATPPPGATAHVAAGAPRAGMAALPAAVVQSAAAKGAVVAPAKAPNAPAAAAPAKPGAGAPAVPAAPKPAAQPMPSTPAGPGRLETIAEQLL